MDISEEGNCNLLDIVPLLLQAVALLPFIDETRLLNAVAPLEATLTDEEQYRNAKRTELLFMASWHPLAPDVLTMAEEHAGMAVDARAEVTAPVDPKVQAFMAEPTPVLQQTSCCVPINGRWARLV